MKITFEFDSENPDDMDLHGEMLKAKSALLALQEIRQQIFRPARKHGYDDAALNKLIEESGETEDGYNRGQEIISSLEITFGEILEEHGVGDI